MTIRIYRSYDESSLRTLLSTWKDDPIAKLATLFNYRNHPSASDVSEVVVYRNTFGDLFEMRFSVIDNMVHVASAVGGTFLGRIEFGGCDIEAALWSIESLTRRYSEGFVPCGDCGAELRRFSSDIVLAYHGGRYCATCAPRYERLASSEID